MDSGPDHPRIRGEHDSVPLSIHFFLGSSPHTRGARQHWARCRRKPRIIPAYAGSTDEPVVICFELADHPRIRGEHRPRGFRSAPGPGSSPHTRGARRFQRRLGVEQPDHPRIRGEHDKDQHTQAMIMGSSPHTRGAHLEIPAIPRIAVVIIPVFLYPSPTPQEEADRSMVLLTLS